MKSIAVFGDSWVWGDELVDPTIPAAVPHTIANQEYREAHCFAGLIGKQLNLPVYNFAIPGGSLQSTIWNYLWFAENYSAAESLILVGLTDPSRHTFYNPNHVVYPNDPEWNRYVHTAWAAATDCYSNEWTGLIKRFQVLSNCDKWQDLNFRQTLMFFTGQPNVIQFNTVATREHPNLFWQGMSLKWMLESYPDCLAPNRHPNERGHEILSELLLSYIESCKMLG